MSSYSALISYVLWCVVLCSALVVAQEEGKKTMPHAPPQPPPRQFHGDAASRQRSSSPNLVVNGDFQASPDYKGWRADGGYISLEYSGSARYAALGTQYDFGYIMQTIPTVAGQSYTLEFLLLSVSLDSFLTVSFGSATVKWTAFTTRNNDWEYVSVTATALSSSTDLYFYERNDPSYFYIDNVSVTQTSFGATQTQTDVCAGSGQLGTATITPVGGTPPFTYAWTPSGGNQATATGLTARTYTVTVTDALGVSIDRKLSIVVGTNCAAIPSVVVQTIPMFNASQCSGPFMISKTVTGSTYSVNSLDLDMNTCTFYSAAGCASASSFTTFVATGNSKQFYLNCDESWYQTISVGSGTSNVFQVVKYTSGGDVCGDPHFIGYDGRDFLFNGEIGKYYNIFSNPYVTVNSLFADAHGANPLINYTINGVMGVHTMDFNISLDPHAYDEKTSTIVFNFNGKNIKISEDEKQYLHNGCVEINFEKTHKTRHHHHTFSVNTHKFKLNAYVSRDSNVFINTAYLDYYIAHNSADVNLLGGIIGDTAGEYDPYDIVDHPERYAVDDMFSASSKFGGLSVCKGTEQQGREVVAKRAVCQTLPNGYRCYKHGTCSSGWCGAYGVCQPWDGCFNDHMCGTGLGRTCNLATKTCSRAFAPTP